MKSLKQKTSPSHLSRIIGFTIIELVIAAAILSLVMSIGFRSFDSFLQERRLRQAAIELASYLQQARSRALKQVQNDNSDSSYCQISLSSLTFSPPASIKNSCNNSIFPPLAPLDLAASSSARGLVIEGGSQSLTFTNLGALASWNPGNNTMISMPRIFYLKASNTTAEYCIYLDLISIRIGVRNAGNDSNASCVYNRT